MEDKRLKIKAGFIKLLHEKTVFERKVLLATIDIPRGKVTTYKRLAERIGIPRAYRAVGNSLHKNPHPSTIPCHRVIRSDGMISGSEKSVETRRQLLVEEGIPIIGNRIKLNKEILF